MRFVANPFKGKEKGKSDDTNEDQWNSAQRSPKDGSASASMKTFGNRESDPEIAPYPKFGGNGR